MHKKNQISLPTWALLHHLEFPSFIYFWFTSQEHWQTKYFINNNINYIFTHVSFLYEGKNLIKFCCLRDKTTKIQYHVKLLSRFWKSLSYPTKPVMPSYIFKSYFQKAYCIDFSNSVWETLPRIYIYLSSTYIS